jgi:hypothetical protein
MSTHLRVTRRFVLIGGCSVILVGCDQAPGGASGSNSDPTYPQLSLPSWAELGLFLTMATVAGPVGGALAGALRLKGLETFLRGVGVFADYASMIYDAIEAKNQLRSHRFALPSPSDSPKPFIVPESGAINDFESVPVFRNDVTLQLGVLNEQGGNFGEHDIYATVKRVDEPAPRTLSDVFGSADLPHAIVSPAPNGNWDGRLDIGALSPGAFISYSWKVPRGGQPSDDYIASTAFVGPAFLSVDDANYSLDLAEAVDSGRNVEARFQLPDASVA